MFTSAVARMFGIVRVHEKNNVILVTGIPADVLLLALENIYKTRRINRYIFLKTDHNSVMFYSFFAVEVKYLLEALLERLISWRIKRVVRKILVQLNENTWLKRTTDNTIPSMVDVSLMKNLKWSPKDYQYSFVVEYGKMVPRYDLRGFLLAIAPGGGKTFTDLLLAACVVPRSIAEVKIIISPKNAIRQVWAKTVENVMVTPPTWWVSDEEGPVPESGVEYYIFHFEALMKADALCRKLHARGIRFFVIIDESHNFNTINSQRTQALIEICSGISQDTYSIWASGSPIKAVGTEAVPMLRSIDPKFTPPVEAAFKRIFSGDSPAANEILNHRLGLVSYKVPKSLIMDSKPTYHRVDVKLKDPTRYLTSTVKVEMKQYIADRIKVYQKDIKKYRELFDKCVAIHKGKLTTPQQKKLFDQYYNYTEILKKIGGTNTRIDSAVLNFCKNYEKQYLLPSLPGPLQREFKEVRSIVKNTMLKVRGEALGRVLGKRRAECATELVKHCGLENIVNESIAKTLVFATYTSTVNAAADYLISKGLSAQRLTGEVSKDLNKIVDQFHEDPDMNPLCATYALLSTAVPVTVANTVVFASPLSREYAASQTLSRADRLGQKHPVHSYELYLDTGSESNVSTSIGEILQWSRNQIAEIVGPEFGGPEQADYELLKFEQADL